MSGRTCRPAPSARPGPRTGGPTDPASSPRPHPAAAQQPAPALARPHLRPRGRGVCLLAHRPGATPALTSRLWRRVRTLLCPTLANFWEFTGSGPTTLKCFWATALYPCPPTYIACSAASWWPDPFAATFISRSPPRSWRRREGALRSRCRASDLEKPPSLSHLPQVP